MAIGPSDVLSNEFISKGLPLKHFDPDGIKEGTYMTSGNGTIAIVRNPPHPNALKVYLDFLLSKEGQLEWSKGAGMASLRRDVPRDHVLDVLIPKDNVNYQENHQEKYLKLRSEIVAFIKPLLEKRGR
jgi:ABC-type Fe3+ transport system substrate-binding protein